MTRKAIDAVCTMATKECAEELALFHCSLRAFHPTLPLYLGCTSEVRDGTSAALASTLQAVHRDTHIHWIPCLDTYGPDISRKVMEKEAGTWYATRHTDFMMEKTNLMEFAMRSTPPVQATPACTSFVSRHPVVAFLDCDITLLRGLPTIPATASIALSPHDIRYDDEALFGRFNGGYVVASHPEVLWLWRRATATSRYFDQASLEHVADSFRQRGQLHCLPPQHNYGFWRLLQPQCGSAFEEAARFSIATAQCAKEEHKKPLTILYDKRPLCSIHTHFRMHGSNTPRDVRLFNDLLIRWMRRCTSDKLGKLRNQGYANALKPIIN